MEARALYDFRAQQEDEISFSANAVLKILQLEEVSPTINVDFTIHFFSGSKLV